ncbi:MAG: redox-sensing transcriptional repressor Rex [Candidatus Bipolaricaulia bacterium]
MKEPDIPEETVERLVLYLRQLEKFYDEGKKSITSQQFAEKLPGINSHSLRKDLTYFGTYGKKGTGYDISRLIKELRSTLSLQATRKVALVGVGNLGTALLNYNEFGKWNFDITFAFDKDPELIGSEVGGVQVRDPRVMEKELRAEGVKMAIIAVPGDQAQVVAESLVSVAVEGILNFAPVLLDLPEEVRVVQLDIVSQLEKMDFYLER